MEGLEAVERLLDAGAREHLHRLMAAWQLIADLSFGDLLLFVPLGERTEAGERFQVAGQLRPYTARTLYPQDLVGEVVEAGWHPYMERAWREERRLRPSEPVFIDAEPVRIEAVPVRHRGRKVAVLCVEAAEVLPDRPKGRLETAYLTAADALLGMVFEGTFPFDDAHDLITSPRVGDGLVSLDASGRIEFASPNATSAFRRLGVTALVQGEPLPHRAGVLVAEAMSARRPVEADLEASGAVVDLRIIPLLRRGRRQGALVLCRDATELRRRDRVISRRETTIREVHHRVKNNLQTVASLLRLQARRLKEHPQAVEALEESVRRISSIALVHETLTEELEGAVDVADVARRIVRMLEGSLAREHLRIELAAEPTVVDAAVATPLAVILNELVQNAVEHGLKHGPGTVTVRLHGTEGGGVVLEVADDGEGPPPVLPPASSTGGLGLNLVRALVNEELGGSFSLTPRGGRGSVARAQIPPAQAQARADR